MSALLLAVLLTLGANAEIRLERWPNGKPRAEFEVRVEADGSEVLHGSYKTWFENGKVEFEGAYLDGLRTGPWVERSENGKRLGEGSYLRGKRDGKWKLFHARGPKASEGTFREGRREGPWQFWNEDRSKDETRSGTYSFARQELGGQGVSVEGSSLGAAPMDLWVWRRADGSPIVAGSYGRAGPQGPWVALFADGSLDSAGLSGEYEAGLRTGPLEGWPAGLEQLPRDVSRDPRRAPPMRVEAQAAARLEAWLAAGEGAREGPWTELASDTTAALIATVARLQALDFGAQGDDALGRRLNEALVRLAGVSYPWNSGDDAAKANALAALRWRAHLELDDLSSSDWSVLLDPSWRWAPYTLEATVLARPAAPQGWNRAVGDAAQLPPRLAARLQAERDLKLVGGTGTQTAVDNALAWMARAQGSKGDWETGTPRALEATSWCLLALIGKNVTVLGGGEHGPVLTAGLHWLVDAQRPDSGQLATPLCYELRSHALGTWALAEAAATGPLPALLGAAAGARKFLLERQLADGSFARDVRGTSGDALTTLYAWFALSTLRETSLSVDEGALERAMAWLEGQIAADGSLGEPEGRTPVTSAASVLVRTLACRDPDRDALLGRQVGWLIAHPSNIEPRHPQLDCEYLFFGALACFQVGGDPWTNWNKNMKIQLLQVQFRDGADAGSWDPVGIGPTDRASATALRALTFQAYYRYAPPASRCR